MTSRERVRKAVNFEKTDRIPIDLGSIRASGINAALYNDLKKRLGINTPTKVQDTMQILAEIEPEVMEALHIDVVPLDCPLAGWAGAQATQGIEKRLFCGTSVYFSPDTNITEEKDGSWSLCNTAGEVFAHMPKDGFYFDFVRPTMAGAKIDPDAFQPSRTVSDEELGIVASRARHLYENTDKAILGWGASVSMMGLSALLSDNITQGSLDEWLCMLMTEKETVHEMMARYVDATIERTKL